MSSVRERIEVVKNWLASGVACEEVPDSATVEDKATGVFQWVTFAFDLFHRLRVHFDLPIAGENIVGHYLGILAKPVDCQQDSWERGTTGLTGATGAVLAVKESAGRDRGVVATNANASERYLQIFNAASISPADVPFVSVPMPGLGAADFDFPEGDYHDVEIIAAVSLTQNDYTATTADEHLITSWSK